VTHSASGPYRLPLSLRAPRLVGKPVVRFFAHVGRFGMLFLELGRALADYKNWVPRAFEQAYNVGIGSLFIVILTASFTGAVTALQAGYQFTSTVPLYYVGTVITESIILELGPVLTAMILAGRIGARYAAELGTMRVTEQIDALESLGRSPASHLVIPRVLAGLIMIPALTILANLSGILSGWISVKAVLPVTDADFIYGAQYYWRPWDAWYSVIKAFFFAGSITIIACYMGFNTKQGAEGVGRATTGAVVSSSVLILLLDVLLANLLLT